MINFIYFKLEGSIIFAFIDFITFGKDFSIISHLSKIDCFLSFNKNFKEFFFKKKNLDH